MKKFHYSPQARAALQSGLQRGGGCVARHVLSALERDIAVCLTGCRVPQRLPAGPPKLRGDCVVAVAVEVEVLVLRRHPAASPVVRLRAAPRRHGGWAIRLAGERTSRSH